MSRFLKKLTNYKWAALFLIFAISFVFFMIMKSNTRMETDLDKYMPEQHPAFVYSNMAEEWFNIKDGIIIAI